MTAVLTRPPEATAAVGPSTQPETRPKTGRLSVLAGYAGRAGWKSLAVLLFLALWEFGPQYLAGPSTRVFLPPLHEVLAAGTRLVESGQLQSHLQASLTRSVSGFGIAVVSAVVLGLLIAWYGWLNSFLNPLLELFRNTATLALLPVF